VAGKSLHHFLSLPARDRSLLMRAVILVGAARMALWVLPFNAARLAVGRRVRRPSTLYTTEEIGWAVSVAQRFVPKGNCLPQALAAEALLIQCGHPVEFRIGVVKKQGDRLEAHAWVESRGKLVVGDLTQGLSGYSPLPPLPGIGS
jgi:hypothetical protein